MLPKVSIYSRVYTELAEKEYFIVKNKTDM